MNADALPLQPPLRIEDTGVLTTKDAAALLRWTEDTVRRKAVAGEIPAHALGRHWRFYREELHKYIRGEWQPANARRELGPPYAGESAAEIFRRVGKQNAAARRKK